MDTTALTNGQFVLCYVLMTAALVASAIALCMEVSFSLVAGAKGKERKRSNAEDCLLVKVNKNKKNEEKSSLVPQGIP
jgi:hypothetical protein